MHSQNGDVPTVDPYIDPCRDYLVRRIPARPLTGVKPCSIATWQILPIATVSPRCRRQREHVLIFDMDGVVRPRFRRHLGTPPVVTK